MTYIEFTKQIKLKRFADSERVRKTEVWMVRTLDHTPIGEVKWWSAWRKYCFMPKANTIFEEVCLRQIADFVQSRTLEHKAGLGHRQVR